MTEPATAPIRLLPDGRRTSGPPPLIPWTPGGYPEETSAASSTGPFPIVIPPESPPRGQSRWVLILIAAALVLGLVLAVFSLRDLVTGTPEPEPSVGPLPQNSGASEAPDDGPAASAGGSAADPETAAPGSREPIRIATTRSLDPQGDHKEGPGRVKLAFDGDPGTAWTSETYESAEFGGIRKDGVGLSIQLTRPTELSRVRLDLRGRGGTVQLRTGDSSAIRSSRLLDTAPISGGTVTLDASDSGPTRYVILWFTRLPQVDGEFRVDLSEVRLR
jgi:hypothetical protein